LYFSADLSFIDNMRSEKQRAVVKGLISSVDIPGIDEVEQAAIELVRDALPPHRSQSEQWIDEVLRFVRAFCVHFCSQHLRESGPDADICAFNPYQTKVERVYDPKFTMSSIGRMQAFVQNFDALRNQFRAVIEQIEERLEASQNVLIVTNHMTLANIPLIVSLLISSTELPEFLMDSLWTILGPSLMTNKGERDMILSLTNVLMTQPSTVNGQVPGFRQKQTRRAVEFSREFKRLCAESGDTGKLFILAPSGTRDRVVRNETHRTSVRMRQASGGANKLVASLENTVILPVMVDDDGLYTGRIPTPTDVEIVCGDFVNNGDTCLDEQMQILAGLVCDQNRVQIGELYGD
jgi:hypothetical protein